ncbi:hypothetical protein N7470_007222 [Penicillium chermesinum]|nr:hypothetical protein N7470_007222 [Penicillium chermesinum]
MGAAFRNGNMASVRALLGLQPDSQLQSSDVAVEPEMVSRMKQFFVELDGQTMQSKSEIKKSQELLFFALQGKCVSILRLLLFTNFVDFNEFLKNSGRTPLSWSILKREPGMVDFLVSEAKINIQAHINNADRIKRPLLRTAFRSTTEYDMIIPVGVDQWAKADRGILDILLRQDSLNLKCQDEDRKNAVHWAALANDEWSLKSLIKRGFDYEHCDYMGRDPLSHAAELGHVDIVKALLEIEGIEVDRRDETGRTPLIWAVNGSRDRPIGQTKLVVESLFRTNRVDFNARDNYLRSPLATAVSEAYPGSYPGELKFC